MPNRRPTKTRAPRTQGDPAEEPWRPFAREVLAKVSATWGVDDLNVTATFHINRRFSRSLARVRLKTHRIDLAEAVTQAAPEVLAEILCHEAAHIVAYARHGETIRPHGKEWAALVRAAGYEPRATADTKALGITLPKRKRRRPSKRYRYLHHCPHCNTTRTGGRVVREWRCATCVKAGRTGLLTVLRGRAQRSRGGLRRLLRR